MYGNKLIQEKARGCFGGSKPGKKKTIKTRRTSEEVTATVAMPGTVGRKLFKQLHKRNIIEQLKKRQFDKRRGYVAEAPK
jgi:hypothetical protein